MEIGDVIEAVPVEYRGFVRGLVRFVRREAWEPVVRYLLGEEVLCRELPEELRVQLPFEDDERVVGLEPVVARGRVRREIRRNAWAWYRPAAETYTAWYNVYVNGYAIFHSMPLNAVWLDAKEEGKVFGWWPAGAGAAGLVKLLIANARRTIPPWVYRRYRRFSDVLREVREEGLAVRLRDLEYIAGRRLKLRELSDHFEYRVVIRTGNTVTLLFPTEDSRLIRIWDLEDVSRLARSEPWPVEDPIQPLGGE